MMSANKHKQYVQEVLPKKERNILKTNPGQLAGGQLAGGQLASGQLAGDFFEG